jgi:hypothetical protein
MNPAEKHFYLIIKFRGKVTYGKHAGKREQKACAE